MKNLRASNPRKMMFFGAVILALSLLMIFLAREIIREAIVLPLSYLVWLGGVLLDTTPQIVFWIGALFIAGLTAYRSLASRRKPVAEEIPVLVGETTTSRSNSGGQVTYWGLRVENMRRSPSLYFIGAFHQSVNRMLMDELAYRYRLTPRQVEERLRDDELDVPPEVRDYVLSALGRQDREERPFLADLWARIRQIVRDLARGNTWDGRASGGGLPYGGNISPDEEKVHAVLSYLEKELEVSNDDTGR